MNYLEFTRLLLPETILLLAALVAVGAGCSRRDNEASPARNARLPAIVAITGILLAGASLWLLPEVATISGGMWVFDPLIRLFKLLILAMTLLTVCLLWEMPPTAHAGENFGLVLFAAIGLLLLVSTEELLVIFLALELTAIALYIAVGFARSDKFGAEAALKYFLFGSVAAAFLLYGFSLIYGFTGSTALASIAASLANTGIEPILTVGLALALVGFGFKVAAVPFHLWTPDVYQGAPLPAAALIASASKLAGFFILAKWLLLGFTAYEGSAGWGNFAAGWVPMVAIMAALSMVVGNLAALAQTSVRRLLAYSGIGHAGFMLLALAAATPEALNAVLFYAVIYGFATIGAFAVVAVVLRECGNDRITDFSGLAGKAPLLAFCLLIFLISLAGLPPLAGFFGKFYLFTTAMGGGFSGQGQPGMLWLVLLALLMSAISLYYYLIVLKQAFFANRPDGLQDFAPHPLSTAICLLIAAAIIALGCYPELLLNPIRMAQAAGF